MYRISTLATLLLLAACGADDAATSPAKTYVVEQHAEESAINWRYGGVDEALTVARDSNKPVLLYWGAVWCPPCMQLKSTVFKDPAFIRSTEKFVAVYLDGDSEGAQRWGEHFAIVGYPTMIILRPDGTELTRISSGMALDAYPRVLDLAAKQTRPVGDLLAQAQADASKLSLDDWMLLANYGWFVDQDQALQQRAWAPVMTQLSRNAPAEPRALKTRFKVLELVAKLAEAETPETALSPAEQSDAIVLLRRVMKSKKLLQENISELHYYGVPALTAATAIDGEQRQELSALMDRTLRRVRDDQSYTLKDRLYTARTRLLLHKANHPDAELPKALVEFASEAAQWADSQARTPQQRQSAINYATYVLEEAGLQDQAEQLLLAEIQRSEQPYYFMPTLAEYAQARGDTDAALDWLKRAYEESRGPATRAQWGVLYVQGLLEMAPGNVTAIEAQLSQMISELAEHPGAFYQRTRSRMKRVDSQLRAWSQEQDAAPVLQRLAGKMQPVCEALDAAPAKQDCEALFASS